MNDNLKNLYCLLTQIRSIYSTTWLRLGCHKPRKRPLRRFTLGREGQASSSMPEWKPRPGPTREGRSQSWQPI